MSKKSDEKKKHFASFLSAVATALMNVGIFAPAIAYLYNIGDLQGKAQALDLFKVNVIIFIIIIVLIVVARKILERLDD